MNHRTLATLILVPSLLGACAADPADPPDESSADSALSSGVQWQPLGMSGIAQLQMTRDQNGSVAVIARTTGGGLMFDEQNGPGAGWKAPASLGGWGLQDFAVTAQADGRLVVFALGGDGAIYMQTQNAAGSSAFSGWSYLGGHGLIDVAAAREADGLVVMLAVGADHNVYEQRQSSQNGGFDPWTWVGGPGVIQIAMAAQPSGRLALIGRTPDGEMMFTNQPSVNANFLGWTSLGGTQLTDFTLAKNLDGRLEMLAIGGDTAVYDKPQAHPDLDWADWSGVGQSGVTSVATTLAADGSLNLFMVGSDHQVHRVAQNGPGGGLIGEPAMGGNNFVKVSAEHDLDGRMEVMGLAANGTVYQTWQTSPGGPWLALPPPPVMTYTSSIPNPAQVGSTVTFYWDVSVQPGCTVYSHVDIQSPLQGNKQIGSWNGALSGQATFTIQDDTYVSVTAGCAEGWQSGVTIESKRGETVHATQPTTTTSTYRLNLSQEIPYSGPIPWGADFGVGIPNGKLIQLKNPYPYYVMSVIAPHAPNTDCWTSKAVQLAAGASTTAADITKLYGTATPSVPLHIHACLNQTVSGYAQIDVTYTH